jgi:predicted GNAT family N-acyltransferase
LLESTFHLGLVDEATSEITCILTCMEENHKNVPSDAYRLRGMATNPKYRRQGHAKRLLEFAMEYLKKEKGMNYLWFNARVIAFPFYEAMGFEYMSEEFELEGIGPHREMFKFFGERESGAVETGDIVLLNENE